MVASCTTYSTEAAAREALAAWSDGGAPTPDIILMTGSPRHDIGQEPVGGFAGPIGPLSPVGTYGDAARLRRQAEGGFAGDPDRQRQGSFADTDRVVIATAHDGARRARVGGHRDVRRMLRDTGFEGDARRLIDELAMGRSVVVARGWGVRPNDPWSQLAHLRHAA
jgi:hypothetical protein